MDARKGRCRVTDLPTTPETVSSWDTEALGRHRAVVAVDDPAEAVRVRVPWRRRDPSPETTGLTVVSARSGDEVRNVLRTHVGRDQGVLAFEPVDGPGTYWVYYLPYTGTTRSYYPRTEWAGVEDTADPGWLAWVDGALRAGQVPEARAVALETTDAFDAFTPMEAVASPDEVAGLLSGHPDARMLVFAEDRDSPIRMTRDLPARWVERGPDSSLALYAARGEFRVFQLGVFAARGPASALSLRFGDLVADSGDGALSSARFRCTNLGGVGWDGQPIVKRVDVDEGRVQALWCGLDIAPDVAPGLYRGRLTISSAEGAEHTVELIVEIGCDEVPDCGDDEPWRLSRLRWLDSTIGSEDEIVAPFAPVEVHGPALHILGRHIELGPLGLPQSIVSTFTRDGTGLDGPPRPVLARPIELIVEDASGTPLVWEAAGDGGFTLGTSYATWSRSGCAGDLALACHGRIEMDGMVACEVALRAARGTDLRDARLEVAIPRDVARYMTGLGRKGGRTPQALDWTWDAERNQDAAWIGDVGAGLQLALRDERYSRPLNTNFYHLKPLVVPRSWGNDGQGGIRIRTEEDGTCRLECYGGPRSLVAGEELRFDFRLLLTPFKPLDPEAHFQTRYFHACPPLETVVAAGANTVNVHHATEINPYINYPFLRPAEMRAYVDAAHERECAVKVYYTVRELTTRAPELFALHSLGGEVLVDGPGGGHPWVREHLQEGYIPAWHDPTFRDTSVINGVLSRWHNFYVEGLAWLARHIGIDGLYLDDVGFGREVMQRARRVLARWRPRPLVDLHSANQYNERDGFASSANLYLELMPYVDRLWFGEYFDYNETPDYWLVEISGLCFGLMGEMLEGNGNPWRGMVYGMTGRLPAVEANSALWRFWDEYGLPDCRMLGYWSPHCPVRTGREDVLATAYVGESRCIIALASWAGAATEVALDIDCASLGLGGGETSLVAPAIEGFQPAWDPAPTDAIPIEPGKGWLLVAEGGRQRTSSR